jgi:D-inositol-3-phosphate glycosyltransferase
MQDNTEKTKNRSLKILMGLTFYPRGGSAQVVRYLSRALIQLGHQVHLVTGSLRDGDPQHDAEVFYGGLPLTAADYTPAWQGFTQGRNPISGAWQVPFQPSYEDKPDVPDRVFYKVNQTEYAALLRCWQGMFQDGSRHFQPDVLHLHHLNHMHLAAARAFPWVPRATQLHGTELKMLENLALLEEGSGIRHPLHDYWRDVLTQAARSVQHFFAISPDVRQRGIAQFSIQDSDVTTIPNGVDISLFKPLDWTDAQKLALLRKILVDEPQGWDESGVPGTVRYTAADLERFTTRSGQLKPLAMFVGRFLDFKRVPLLVEAVARVNQMFEKSGDWPPFNLLVWGGMPGEWEGQHPYTLARQLGLPNVFFTGWLPHAVLSKGLNLADVFVAPSHYEPFGQVFLEAMATRLPVIATRSGGPLSFVADSGREANGWFCKVDDVHSLAQTIYAALTSAAERKRRGDNALALIQSTYSWMGIARQYVTVYRQLTS